MPSKIGSSATLRGTKWPGQLLERRLTGQRAISLLLKPGDPTPRVGQALGLIQHETQPTEFEQYVRITRVTTTEREFSVNDGSGLIRFTGLVATCEISDPLRFDFEGPAPSHGDGLPAKAIVRDTLVANAAVYYGIAPTVAAVHLGEMRVQVPSLFEQLIPSAQAETPLVDLPAAGQTTPLIESGTGPVSFMLPVQLCPGQSLYLGNAFLPGSLSLNIGGYESVEIAGDLKSGSRTVGSVDYARGAVGFREGTPKG